MTDGKKPSHHNPRTCGKLGVEERGSALYHSSISLLFAVRHLRYRITLIELLKQIQIHSQSICTLPTYTGICMYTTELKMHTLGSFHFQFFFSQLFHFSLNLLMLVGL